MGVYERVLLLLQSVFSFNLKYHQPSVLLKNYEVRVASLGTDRGSLGTDRGRRLKKRCQDTGLITLRGFYLSYSYFLTATTVLDLQTVRVTDIHTVIYHFLFGVQSSTLTNPTVCDS